MPTRLEDGYARNSVPTTRFTPSRFVPWPPNRGSIQFVFLTGNHISGVRVWYAHAAS